MTVENFTDVGLVLIAFGFGTWCGSVGQAFYTLSLFRRASEPEQVIEQVDVPIGTIKGGKTKGKEACSDAKL